MEMTKKTFRLSIFFVSGREHSYWEEGRDHLEEHPDFPSHRDILYF